MENMLYIVQENDTDIARFLMLGDANAFARMHSNYYPSIDYIVYEQAGNNYAEERARFRNGNEVEPAEKHNNTALKMLLNSAYGKYPEPEHSWYIKYQGAVISEHMPEDKARLAFKLMVSSNYGINDLSTLELWHNDEQVTLELWHNDEQVKPETAKPETNCPERILAGGAWHECNKSDDHNDKLHVCDCGATWAIA